MSSRLPFLYIRNSKGKGKGVFTAQDIPAGSPIESCPVIILPSSDTALIHQTKLHDYYFLWGESGACAIALGFGSLYNHATNANADYRMDLQAETIDITAIHLIKAGSEITINYVDGGLEQKELWFEELGG